MTLIKMYDSTVPESIPDDAPAVAYYMDGPYAWATAQVNRFKGKPRFPISVQGNADASVLDYEPGACTLDEVIRAYHYRRSHGKPTITYVEESKWAGTYTALKDALREPAAFWWVAAWYYPAGALSLPMMENQTPPSSLPGLKRVASIGRQYLAGGNLAPTYDMSVIDIDRIPRELYH